MALPETAGTLGVVVACGWVKLSVDGNEGAIGGGVNEGPKFRRERGTQEYGNAWNTDCDGNGAAP